jgi:thiol-disulfide isomerase/thioredoxin
MTKPIAVAALVSSGLLSCAGVKTADHGAASVVLSIQNLACLDCGAELEERARDVPGVQAAHFDPKKIEMTVELAPGTPLESLVQDLEAHPVDGKHLTVIVGAGKGKFAPFAALDPKWDAKILVQHGEDVAGFEPTPGRVTVVDFFAEWCGPCHELDDAMQSVLKKDPDKVAYRRLNVVDWDSPIAKHYLGGVPELPFVIVLSRTGKEVARLSGYKPQDLRRAIEEGMR